MIATWQTHISGHVLSALLAVGLSLAACTPAPSSAPTGTSRSAAPDRQTDTTSPANSFYAGKTIRVIVATTAGSAFDLYGRTLARHMPKYIPGNPTMIVENMPGAGHMIATNHLYRAAPKDGTVFGTFIEQQVVNQVSGGEGVEFDAAKFNWLGAAARVNQACLVRTDTSARITSFTEMLGANGKRAVFATTGAGSSGYEYPVLFKEVLGANIQVVSGYKGNPEVRLAIEGGEADGYCASWDAVSRGLQPWKDAGTPPYQIIVQQGEEREAALADVPMAIEFVRNEADRQLFNLLDAPGNMAKPFAAPPGVPADRLAILREAFIQAWRDPAAIEELRKGDVSLDPRTAAQVEATVRGVLNTPREVVERYAKIMGR